MEEEPYLRFSCKDWEFLNCDELLAEKITGEIDDVDTEEPRTVKYIGFSDFACWDGDIEITACDNQYNHLYCKGFKVDCEVEYIESEYRDGDRCQVYVPRELYIKTIKFLEEYRKQYQNGTMVSFASLSFVIKSISISVSIVDILNQKDFTIS